MDLPIPLWLVLAIVAPFIGSFIGVLIDRLPNNKPIALGRSQCDSCNKTLAARDLIPFVSWFAARGACRYCGAKLSWFYPAIELAALVIVLWAALVTSGWPLFASCILGWTLLALAVIDWRHFILPDLLNAFLLATGLGFALAGIIAAPIDHLIGAFAGFTAFAGIAFLYAQLRGQAGLGFGDAKLLGALGAWVTWTGLASIVLYGAVLGLISVLVASVLGHKPQAGDRIPFGTYLAMGGWLVWLYGPLAINL